MINLSIKKSAVASIAMDIRVKSSHETEGEIGDTFARQGKVMKKYHLAV